MKLNQFGFLVPDTSGGSEITVIPLTDTSFTPIDRAIYTYTLTGGETFVFDLTTPLEFKLFLTMPDPAVSFTLPPDIIWAYGQIPDMTVGNKTYRLSFLWDGETLYGGYEDLSEYAKLTADNIFHGNNTFLNGICLSNPNTTYGTSKFVQGYAVGSTEWNNTPDSAFSCNTGKATGVKTHAEGNGCTASGNSTHAEGSSTTASGYASHAEGYACGATHSYAHVEGNYNKSGDQAQHVAGRFNVSTTGARVTGGGTDADNRANIEVLDWSGNLVITGVLLSAGQLIETLDTPAIIPVDNKVFKRTLEANDVITIDTTVLTAAHQINFELHLTQPSTAVAFTWGTTMIWGDGDTFNSSNTAPAMSDASTTYVVGVRWNGTHLLANLAYKEN